MLLLSSAVQALWKQQQSTTVSLLSSAVEDPQRSSEAFQVLSRFLFCKHAVQHLGAGSAGQALCSLLSLSRQQCWASKAACSSKSSLCMQATGLQLVKLLPTLPFDSKGTSAVSEMP